MATTIPTPAELDRFAARIKASHLGGGYYLVAGRKIRGKKAAAQAMAKVAEEGANPNLNATTKKAID